MDPEWSQVWQQMGMLANLARGLLHKLAHVSGAKIERTDIQRIPAGRIGGP
jgi:hypothetical protein